MSKKITYFSLIVLTIACGSFLNWKYCCNAAADENSIVKQNQKVITHPVKRVANAFYVTDQQGIINFEHPDNINFLPSDFSIISPVSKNVDTEIEKLKQYLGQHPDKTIGITGYYKTNEEYDDAFPNLGIARANAVKNYFVTKGISSEQIDIQGSLKDELVIEKAMYKGPLSFIINTIKDNSDTELLTLKNSIQASPLVLYFNTGESAINLSPAQKQKIASISRYLDKSTSGSAVVTGHTDNIGNPKTNTILGQKRADFAKIYLINNGISEKKIITDSKGPLEPMVTNDTKEGRAKNRRTVITIN